MNKSELIDAIAKQVDGVSKKAVGDLVDAFTSTLETSLKKGDGLTLVGFGTFSVSKRAARVGRNPRTGEALKIAASKVVRFSPGSKLKAAVNGKK